MASLVNYNAAHMTGRIKFVKGFHIGGCPISLLEKFQKQRSLRKPVQDFLHNDGQPIYDGDKKMLLTGCDSSAKILAKLAGQLPVLVKYPCGKFLH